MRAFGVKTYYKYTVKNEVYYEEIILRVTAGSFDEAYNKAISYAMEMSDKMYVNPDGEQVHKSFAGAVDCFEIFSDHEEIEEVYSSFIKKPPGMPEADHFELISRSCLSDELKPLRHK